MTFVAIGAFRVKKTNAQNKYSTSHPIPKDRIARLLQTYSLEGSALLPLSLLGNAAHSLV